ncbi:MAG: MoaD/ThiS family protein [Candidatus Hydrogenedentota bacterium]|nr:MAG: MoaD/ThiS family protein [Candidatus Hydrogenedentota bacterium]
MATIRIPAPLRRYTNGAEEVAATGATVAAIIDDLGHNYAGLKERLCDEAGNVRRFVNIYVNDEDIRFLQSMDTPVSDSDELSIVPAIAGGRFDNWSSALQELAEV